MVSSKIRLKECMGRELRKRGDGGFVESQLQPRPDPELALEKRTPATSQHYVSRARAEGRRAGKFRCTVA